MPLFHQSPPQTLSAWLEIATRDLVPSVQTRIRAEIEAHYTEAVTARLANGSPKSIAQTAALADLGDAQSAARRFRQKYLTRFEVHRIRETTKGSISWEIAVLFLYWLLPFGVLIRSPKAEFLPSSLLLAALFGPIFALIAVQLAIYFLAKRKAATTVLGKILLIRLTTNLAYACAMLAAGWHLRSNILQAKLGAISENDSLQFAAAVFILIYCAGAGFYQYYLRQKLLTWGENWNAADYLSVWP